MTRITEEKPPRIATVTRSESHPYPGMNASMALTTDASFPAVRKNSTGASPVSTCAKRM